MSYLTPLPEDFFRSDEIEDRLVYTGTELEINGDKVSPLRHLVVRAIVLRISGRLQLPGRQVNIFCRHLIAMPGAEIDVSGVKGDPDFTGRSRAADGRSPGAHGSTGGNGGDGQPGGSILIRSTTIEGNLVCKSNGGDGGKAQDGGNGATGGHGRHGSKGGFRSDGVNGGNGGVGGNAGAAGTPGSGGKAGSISVHIRQKLKVDQIITELNGGAAGAAGSHGQPGKGGARGEAGYWIEEWSP